MAQPTSTSVQKDAHPFERASLESLLIRRFFFAPAFEIYGGQFPPTSLSLSLGSGNVLTFLHGRCQGSLRLCETALSAAFEQRWQQLTCVCET